MSTVHEKTNQLVKEVLNGFVFDPEKDKEYLSLLADTFSDLAFESNRKKKNQLYFYIGVLYYVLQKPSLAIKYLKKALAYDGRLVYYILGLSYWKLARKNKTLDFFFICNANYTSAILYMENSLCFDSEILSDFQINFDLCEMFFEIREYNQLSDTLDRLIDLDEDNCKDIVNEYTGHCYYANFCEPQITKYCQVS